MRARLALGAVLLGAAGGSAAVACSNGPSGPLGSGDKVYVDVDATYQAPAPAADGGGVFTRLDSGYGATDSPGYATCKACACPATDYCFGGGPGYAYSGSCDPGATFGVGCMPLATSGCPDGSCECLNTVLRTMVGCYADCVQNTTTVYCTGY